MRPYQPRLQNGLMKDSNSQHEETSGGRRDVARSAFPQDRRPTKQAETKRTHNPVQLMPPRFEHEHDDDLVADLGVRLRRASQSSRSR